MFQGKKTDQYDQNIDAWLTVWSQEKGGKLSTEVYHYAKRQDSLELCDLIRKCDYIQKKGQIPGAQTCFPQGTLEPENQIQNAFKASATVNKSFYECQYKRKDQSGIYSA